ncbi:MAG: hypothetical protein KDI88_09365 [Gammaproteobacteria bacterium]|nr:hypothetical protein [Gammaproteobacteria bacterium]
MTAGAAALAILLALTAAPASAGKADVLTATIEPGSDGRRFTISVTLRHADSGWDHYANRWEVVGPDGRVLATRTLYHPHVDEQPFTRSLGDIDIPMPITWVKIRGHDLVHGHGGREVTLSVPR